MLLLKNRFAALCGRIGRPSPAVFIALAAIYAQPERAYHNLGHIKACLDEYDAARQEAQNPDAVETAIWFHDAIYDPHRSDNEQRSADLASSLLGRCGGSDLFCDRVKELILLTRHDRLPETSDGQFIIDIDLAILGKSPELFDAYEHAIRVEYRHVNDGAFRVGRAKVLQHFVDRERIYYTDDFFERYEVSARKNLQRSINSLAIDP